MFYGNLIKFYCQVGRLIDNEDWAGVFRTKVTKIKVELRQARVRFDKLRNVAKVTGWQKETKRISLNISN